jgi:hypothetical protein
MNPIESPNVQAHLVSLDNRLRRAERGLLINKVGWLTIVALGFLLLWTKSFGVVQAQSQKLRLRELDIVDEKGRERIVIASPLPDPIVNGKVGHRIRVVSAAVQFKAPDGTDQGGIALSDDGSFMFGIDDETGRERAHLYYIPKRGSGVYLQGESSKETVSLLLPAGGKDPKLEMMDKSGKSVATVPPQR